MGILQNGFRDTIGVFRTYGGTVSNNCYPQGTLGNYNLTGAKRNLTAGEGITDDMVGLPLGYVMKGWQMPQKAGMISARIDGISLGVAGSALLGYPIVGNITLTIDMPTASGQAVASGTGIADFNVTCNNLTLTSSLNGSGTADFLITGAITTLGAEASITGEAPFEITGTIDVNAWGLMEGTTVDSSVLTSDTIAAAVWSVIAAEFNETGTMGNKLNTASSGGVDMNALAQAVWEYATRTLTSSGDVWSDPKALTVAKFLGLK